MLGLEEGLGVELGRGGRPVERSDAATEDGLGTFVGRFSRGTGDESRAFPPAWAAGFA